MTITLTCSRYPQKLIEYLERKQNIRVIKNKPGIYYFENTDITTQLIITKELNDEDAAYLKLLQLEHKNSKVLNNWINEYFKNIKNPLYAIIMDVLTECNPNEILEVYREMGIAKISEDNKAFLMEAIKKLEIDKKIREEGIEKGIEKGKEEDAINLLKLGVNEEIVIKAIGITPEKLQELKRKLN